MSIIGTIRLSYKEKPGTSELIRLERQNRSNNPETMPLKCFSGQTKEISVLPIPIASGAYGDIRDATLEDEGKIRELVVKAAFQPRDQEVEEDMVQSLYDQNFLSHRNICHILGYTNGGLVMDKYQTDLYHLYKFDRSVEKDIAKFTNTEDDDSQTKLQRNYNQKRLNRAKDIVNAVNVLLEQGVRHNDTHFGNFMVEKNGCLRMIDFGLLTKEDTLNENESQLGLVDYIKYDELFKKNAPKILLINRLMNHPKAVHPLMTNPIAIVKRVLMESACCKQENSQNQYMFPETRAIYKKCESLIDCERQLYLFHAVISFLKTNKDTSLDLIQILEDSEDPDKNNVDYIEFIKDVYKSKGGKGLKKGAEFYATKIKQEFQDIRQDLNNVPDMRPIKDNLKSGTQVEKFLS